MVNGRAVGQLVHADTRGLATRGDQVEVAVRIGAQDHLKPGRSRSDTSPCAADRPIGTKRHPRFFVWQHVSHRQRAARLVGDLCAPRVPVRGFQVDQVLPDQGQHLLGRRQKPLQFLDQGYDLAILVLELLALERGQPPQLHVEDRLCLDISEAEFCHQAPARQVRRARAADQGDHLIEDIQCLEQTFEDVGALLSLGQIVLRPPYDNILPVLDEV